MNQPDIDTDLNIDNYTYEDLLALFKLEYDFDVNDMKRAKKVVLMTHPDKSKLPNKYFLFYSNAYKLIYHVHEFRCKSKKSFDDDYGVIVQDSNDSNNELIKQMNKKENFNGWFNRLFDKYYDKNEDGHGDWLSTETEQTTPSVTNMGQMNEYIEKEKHMLSEKQALINYDLEQYTPSGGTSIHMDNTDNFSNENIFSKFQYEDVKKAHEETLIPVSSSILQTRTQFRDADELSRVRQNEIIDIPDKNVSEQMLRNKNIKDTQGASHRAFALAKQEEDSNKKTNMFWSQLKMLEIKK